MFVCFYVVVVVFKDSEERSLKACNGITENFIANVIRGAPRLFVRAEKELTDDRFLAVEL